MPSEPSIETCTSETKTLIRIFLGLPLARPSGIAEASRDGTELQQ